MKQLLDFGLSCNYDLLNSEMKVTDEHRGTACFARVRDALVNKDGGWGTEKCSFVKYYPWTKSKVVSKDYLEYAEKFLNVARKIPFFNERLIEFTGFNDRSEGEELEKYALVDMRAPVDEGFCVLQLLRLLQEKPGHLHTFKTVLEKTKCDNTAFVMALYFTNSQGSPRTGGHLPCNYANLKWLKKFINGPSIAVSVDNNWASNILGGQTTDCLYDYSTFLNCLTQEDYIKHNVAVYGSLRSAHGNHRLLAKGMEENKALCAGHTHRTPVAAKMFDVNGAFPALVPSEHLNGITFELYKVNDEVFKQLDRLEGYPNLYDRVQVVMNDEPYWVYVMDDSRNYKEVKDGDWTEYLAMKGRA